MADPQLQIKYSFKREGDGPEKPKKEIAELTSATKTADSALGQFAAKGGAAREAIEGIDQASKGGMAGFFGLAKAARAFIEVITNANPFLRLIAIIGALVGAITVLWSKLSDGAEEQKELQTQFDATHKAAARLREEADKSAQSRWTPEAINKHLTELTAHYDKTAASAERLLKAQLELADAKSAAEIAVAEVSAQQQTIRLDDQIARDPDNASKYEAQKRAIQNQLELDKLSIKGKNDVARADADVKQKESELDTLEKKREATLRVPIEMERKRREAENVLALSHSLTTSPQRGQAHRDIDQFNLNIESARANADDASGEQQKEIDAKRLEVEAARVRRETASTSVQTVRSAVTLKSRTEEAKIAAAAKAKEDATRAKEAAASKTSTVANLTARLAAEKDPAARQALATQLEAAKLSGSPATSHQLDTGALAIQSDLDKSQQDQAALVQESVVDREKREAKNAQQSLSSFDKSHPTGKGKAKLSKKDQANRDALKLAADKEAADATDAEAILRDIKGGNQDVIHRILNLAQSQAQELQAIRTRLAEVEQQARNNRS